MAKPSQHQQGNSASQRSGAGQTIVELCTVSDCGLVFWSRQRFDIGSELQIRVLRSAIPHLSAPESTNEEWVTLRGYVVECPALRRPSGEHGFQVSLLLDSALTAMTQQPRSRPTKTCPKMRSSFPGLQRVGLN
ncbi:hypothetical protein [Prosthecobacter dejongeii]|uniref:PilZ domain-containing protein n=1 Tax=Prosthecobacter dejongeii TaxID=48465 RepID=A0A7W7YHL6_9BACT|nr:hypothetical protein [Prosthecobacter dejongeii]MBB5036279.1 hypothetical protein [Prosthecobacter dejongeii]